MGTTTGTLPGEVTAGGQDAYIRKYNASGVEQWTVQFGTAAVDVAEGVSLDSLGNVYVAGYTQGTLPGQVSAGSQDAFVRKYNSSGAEQWTSQFGTTNQDSAFAVALDSSNNVFVAGQTLGTFAGQANAGGSDGFVRKLSSAGVVAWTREFGTFDYENAQGCATDASGNVFVVGQTFGSFGGVSAGGYDAYVRRLDSNGNNPWTRQLGSIESDAAHAVATDASGNVFIAGEAEDALPGQTAISTTGSVDSFVAKYDGTGALLWTREFGTTTQDVMEAITVDSSGNAIAVGEISGVLSGHVSAGGAYDHAVGTAEQYRVVGTGGGQACEHLAVHGRALSCRCRGTSGRCPADSRCRGSGSAGAVRGPVRQRRPARPTAMPAPGRSPRRRR